MRGFCSSLIECEALSAFFDCRETTVLCAPPPECGESGSDSAVVNVMGVDISMEGADEEDEESIGAFMMAPGPNEHQRRPFNLKTQPLLNVGTVSLAFENAIAGVMIWKDAVTTQPLSMPHSWDLSTTSAPTTLYIEVTTASLTHGEIVMRQTYSHSNGTTAMDRLRLTVIYIQLIKNGYNWDPPQPPDNPSTSTLDYAWISATPRCRTSWRESSHKIYRARPRGRC